MRLISDDALAIVTIWQEARGEPFEGKVAVGEVIRTRMGRRNRTVAEVVLEPLQFSGWNSHDPNRIPSVLAERDDPIVQECEEAWFRSAVTELAGGATHYVNLRLAAPTWATGMDPTAQIGNHTFYREA